MSRLAYDRDPVVVVIRPVNERCNLSCQYCNAATHSGNATRMDIGTLERIISQASDTDYRFVQFVWHGGEPLLAGLEFFKAAVSFQKRYFGDNATDRYENVVQTNGLLASSSFLDFFQENGFWIGISLDGPDIQANAYRFPALGAKRLFDKTVEVCREVRARGMSLLIICVVHSGNFSRSSELYRFYSELPASKVSFNPRFLGSQSDQNLSPSDFESFLRSFLMDRRSDHSRETPIKIGILDDLMAIARGASPKLCFFGGTCHKFINVDQSGNIFATCTDALGRYVTNLGDNGLTSTIDRSTKGRGVMSNNRLTGCPKYDNGAGDIYISVYEKILTEMSSGNILEVSP